jgi:hypothetical protein
MKIGQHRELVGTIYMGEKATVRQLENLRDGLREIRELVNVQALDEELWFQAGTETPKKYLEQALRKLHALIEDIAQRNDLK